MPRSDARTPVGCRSQLWPPSMVCQTMPSSPAAQPSFLSQNWTACRGASSKRRNSAAAAQGTSAALRMSALKTGRMAGPLSRFRAARSSGPRRSIKHPVPDDAVQRVERILQPDLLAFLVGPARVADRHLVDAPARVAVLGDLRGYLRFEPEAVGLEVQVGQHLAAKDLVAGLHIREVQVREHVRQHRED